MTKQNVMTVRIHPHVPKQQRRVWHDGNLVSNNQDVKDFRIHIPVTYTVKSDYWWYNQKVTDLQGNVWLTDVFQYGEAYVILMTNGDKIQVVNDGKDIWHIV